MHARSPEYPGRQIRDRGGEGDSAEPGAVSQGKNSIQSISRCDKPPPPGSQAPAVAKGNDERTILGGRPTAPSESAQAEAKS